MNAHVLVLDDDPSSVEPLAEGLRALGFVVTCRASADEALVLVESEDFDVVLTELTLPGSNGPAMCERITQARPLLPVVIFTRFAAVDDAIAAIRAGARDYLTKPMDARDVAPVLERVVRGAPVKRLGAASRAAGPFEGMIGTSAAMLRLFDLMARVAASETTALVVGEKGTGKGLVAQAIHRRSARRAAPFVAIHCGAHAERTLEHELFGLARTGATPAKSAPPSAFERADGGTLFLDEVGDLRISLQAKLALVLKERRLPDGRAFDVRVLAATSADPEAAVDEGRLREELLTELGVVTLDVPPLRARAGDLPALAAHFLARCASRRSARARTIGAAAAERLAAYPWPENVRELRSCVERADAIARRDVVEVDDLPRRVREHRPNERVGLPDASGLESLDAIERRHVLRVLEAAGGNRTLAARVLGIERKTLYRKLLQYEQQRKRTESA